MGVWVHRLSNIDPIKKLGTCSYCGTVRVKMKGPRWTCTVSQARWNGRKGRHEYVVHKKGLCEACGFVPINSCQLDVDHIDGNFKNNDTSNLQTLCANCHRLKTHLNEDTNTV